MKEILIRKDATPSELDKILGELKKEHIIRLPNQLSNSAALGASAALTQFLLTWARKAKKDQIKTYLSASPNNDGHRRFIERLHGLAAAYYADSVLSGAQNEESVEIKRNLLKAARPRVEAMHSSDLKETSRGGKEIEFIFIEGAKHEFHGAIYSKAPSHQEMVEKQRHGDLIRGANEISHFLQSCFQVLKVDKKLSVNQPELTKSIGGIIHEAMRNTAEHAYLNVNGSKLNKNLRALRIAKTQTSRKRILEYQMSALKSKERASRYFKSVSELGDPEKRTNIDILEISILDSGPGFAATAELIENIEGRTDQQMVALCFEEKTTSKGNATSGVGLRKILSAIHSLNGFIRVRTSCSEAFFSGSNDFSIEMPPEDYVFGDLPRVEGSLITIGIPIAF